MNNKKINSMNAVIIVQCGNWYSFSPSGHGYYNSRDEMKLHGIKALVNALAAYNCYASDVHGYNLNGHKWDAKSIDKMVCEAL